MNSSKATPPRPTLAFTLIELLVVIAVIGVIAALLFPAAGVIKARAAKSKAQTELSLLVLAIEAYKDKFGHYPPDSPGRNPTNQLYFELMGTRAINSGAGYETLDGSVQLAANLIPTIFGPSVGGFINCTRSANADDAPAAKSFLSQLKPTQYAEIANGVRLLTCSVPWPLTHVYQPVTTHPGVNPFRYVSTSPTNNPGGFDLWVDIFLGGKTNRISNWSKVPQVVSTPY